MVGRLIALRIRSGTGLGPGICRKWRPLECWSRGIMAGAPGSSQSFMRGDLVKPQFLHGLVAGASSRCIDNGASRNDHATMNAPLPTLVTRGTARRAGETIARLGGPEAARL